PNFLPPHFLERCLQSFRAASHFPTLSVPAAESNSGIRSPFGCCESAPAFASSPCKAAALRNRPSLPPAAPVLPTYIVRWFCPLPRRQRERPLRCVALPSRCRVILQCDAVPFETSAANPPRPIGAFRFTVHRDALLRRVWPLNR